MKGLLKSCFYSSSANMKMYTIWALIYGVVAASLTSPALHMSYAVMVPALFSASAMVTIRNEYASKWGKHKLTLPVKRADIVRSYFLNQAIWLFVGLLFVGAVIGVSWLLHGCPFDQPIDVLTTVALGISVSLFMGALYFPLFFQLGVERSDVLYVIAFIFAFCMVYVIIGVVNELLEPGLRSIIIGAAILLSGSVLAFLASCPITTSIFKRKEY